VHLHLVDPAPLRVEYVEPFFFDSYLMLDGSSQTFCAVVELLDEAIREGETVSAVEDSTMRVLRAGATGMRPIRLFFFIEHGTLKFTHVEHYDESEP
jgi:hypothetical protein